MRTALRPGHVACCLLLLCAAACSEEGAREDPQVVATVNGEVLSRADFERELRRALAGFELQPSPEQLDGLRNTVVEQMTEAMLLEQAIRTRAITVTAEDLERRMLQARADLGSEGLEQALDASELQLAEFRERTKATLLLERLFQEEVYARVALTAEEVAAYHQAHAQDFQQAEQVHALQLVVKTQEEARRLRAQLRDGKRFGALAMKYSLSPDAKVGGDLGWFERGVMPAVFDEACFGLAAGALSDVVASDYGYHLFKVVEKRPARTLPLAEARPLVESRLLREKRAAAQAAWVAELKKKANIRINRQTLASTGGGGAT